MGTFAPACRRVGACAARNVFARKNPCFSPCSAPAKGAQTSRTRVVNISCFGQAPPSRWASVCMESLLPLHNAVAASRLVSRISGTDFLEPAIFCGRGIIDDN